jgi:hypothetical protein
MQPLNLSKLVDQPGFMLACDSGYFNLWAKFLFFSIQKHAPWAHVHFHVFDPSSQDLVWLSKNNCSHSTETTPLNYSSSHEDKVVYWCAARYIRTTEIYTDSTPVINLDVDSVMVKHLSKQQFLQDLQHSWVPTAPKRETRSLCSALGLAPDSGRHRVRQVLLDEYTTSRLTWALDQRLCDQLLDSGDLQDMDLRYTDYKMKDTSYIWTGKGNRVNKTSFQTAINNYKHLVNAQ